MKIRTYKNKNPNKPTERNDTAAWANIEKHKDVSQVHIPSELQTDNAKKHVDNNEK